MWAIRNIPPDSASGFFLQRIAHFNVAWACRISYKPGAKSPNIVFFCCSIKFYRKEARLLISQVCKDRFFTNIIFLEKTEISIITHGDHITSGFSSFYEDITNGHTFGFGNRIARWIVREV